MRITVLLQPRQTVNTLYDNRQAVQCCIESPNGRRCRVLGVWRRCLALQRRRSSQAPNTEAQQRGGLGPKWCFIFSASTLSCLHPSSRSRLWGLPLIPPDLLLSPLIPPWAPVCALAALFLVLSIIISLPSLSSSFFSLPMFLFSAPVGVNTSN